MKSIEVGTIVYSIRGRDSGRFYIVVEVVDDKFIKIADGELRRIDKPKLKQIKHVKTDGSSIPKLAEKLKEGKKIFDAEIRSSLRSLNA
ncbi:MAG: RNA-binding protein [Clostridiales bacterium]|jgi:large subunit ribosomal protein L14e|nr:RNA-binding protein [Clostridiales bacterium]HOB64188.1 KOW domain-containing RNA-binding protein [Clostridia bacterium]HOK81953.1 KOW domain-containing RNA-binding protein [Clostridia bacterium]HOL61233.1 KOW domain-containing RNA-binding protein [Clostridia bacterium]HPO53911.1 KOW domain-containing RNA-binding protein [Clostridia bacterium]